MNALQMVQSACGIIGLQRPNSLVGSSDLQVIQLRELLNAEGDALAARSASGWQALNREATFVTVALEDQGTLTTIIGVTNAYRHIHNETIWNRTTKVPLYGPRTGSAWQGFKALTFSGPYAEYRIRGDHLLFLPIPAAGDTCAFEYASKNWLTSSDGTAQRSAIEADEDLPLLDDKILRAGLIWRWKHAKGLDYSQNFQDYESLVIDALARDGTKPRLSLSGTRIDDGIRQAIPGLIGS
jgi:hypothetical protein